MASLPVAKVCCGWKVPLPLPSSTLTVLLDKSWRRRGRALPSPLTSPDVTQIGSVPVAKVLCGLKGAVAVAEQDAHAIVGAVGDGEVELAVAVEVGHGERKRRGAGRECLLR